MYCPERAIVPMNLHMKRRTNERARARVERVGKFIFKKGNETEGGGKKMEVKTTGGELDRGLGGKPKIRAPFYHIDIPSPTPKLPNSAERTAR